jgi:hypothetical protein
MKHLMLGFFLTLLSSTTVFAQHWGDKKDIDLVKVGFVGLEWNLDATSDGFDFRHDLNVKVLFGIGEYKHNSSHHINSENDFTERFVDSAPISASPPYHTLTIGMATGGINCRNNKLTIDIVASVKIKTFPILPNVGPSYDTAEVFYIGSNASPQEFISNTSC